MQTYLKTKPVLVQLLVFLGIAFGIFLLASAVGVFILAKLTDISILDIQKNTRLNFADPAVLTFMRGMIFIQFLFLFTIPPLLFSYFYNGRPQHYLGLHSPSKYSYWFLAVALMFVSYPLVEYIGYWNTKISFSGSTGTWMKNMEEEATRQIAAMLKSHSPIELIKNLIFISLFAGIGEELFFRGVLQRMFISLTKNPWMGIIITAIIFSGIHLQFYGFFPRLILGIFLGAIYWYSGSIWVAMLCHFLYDASVIVAIYLKPDMLQSPDAVLIQGQQTQLLIGAAISLLLTILILRQLKKNSVASFETVYNNDFPKHKDDYSF